ncbi:pilus assembly protein TadG [Rhizobium sp. TH135]|jgi:Flp pilus assembly protein TadG|uniref:TadE/TadG family type IV pilus assembly protein n=1 Tax=Rhizobium sp. TH135 TaxID=2067451 RepID=UPI000C796BD3|nr:TadE/TadG family type IV pilus assembly protein [Rhizobium sp. TH135]PLK70467.1 pilus assembly protein TadG [Rhizobium sp. TH135]
MTSQHIDRHQRIERIRRPRFRLWRKLARSRDGAAAIEFAILAIPYFLIVFAIIETFVAFAAEQLVTNAVNTLGRQLRTGQITYQLNRVDTDMDVTKFRRAFCNEVNIMIQCSESEITTPSKLYIDARTFASFAAIPKTIPRVSTASYADIDPTSFKFTPGGPSTINMLRAYYRWQVITDLVRPYITTIRPADGSMPSDFLIVATTAFQNENYP